MDVLESSKREDQPLPVSSNEYHAISASPKKSTEAKTEEERQWAIKVFSLTTILLFADQNLMSPNLTAMAEEYGFDDEERDTKLGGHIALAFYILGAPAALVVGVLADQFNRSCLFAWTVGIGEGACFLTFFTRTYWGLYVCRALTGFSIGGALPLIYSILGDMFRAEERHKVNAMVCMGTGIGISVGQGIAGFLGPTFGWRLPFLLVSIPALTCAVTVLYTVKDPERGGMEHVVLERKRTSTTGVTNDGGAIEQTEKEMEMQSLQPKRDNDTTETIVSPKPMSESSIRKRSPRDCCPSSKIRDEEDTQDPRQKGPSTKGKATNALFWHHLEAAKHALKILLKTPTVAFALLQGAPGCLPWGVVNTYLNDFLAEDRGMTVEFATFTVLIFGLGNFFGLIMGGAGGQYLYSVDKRYPALLAGSMAIFGCVPFWVLLNGVNNNSSFVFVMFVSIVAGTAAGATGPIIKATLQNVTLPHMRGQAFALFNTADDFGRGIGPVFVSYLITTTGGRTPAFNIGTLGWAVCGVFNLLIFFTAERDEQEVQAALSASLGRQPPADALC